MKIFLSTLITFKKAVLSVLSALFVALFSVLMTVNTHNYDNQLLIENAAALAHTCPECGLYPCECEGFYYPVSAYVEEDEKDGWSWVTFDKGACSASFGKHIGIAYCWSDN